MLLLVECESSFFLNRAHLLCKWPRGINIEYHISSSCSKSDRILEEINRGLGNKQKRGKVLQKKHVHLNEMEEMSDNSKTRRHLFPAASQSLARNKNNMEKS